MHPDELAVLTRMKSEEDTNTKTMTYNVKSEKHEAAKHERSQGDGKDDSSVKSIKPSGEKYLARNCDQADGSLTTSSPFTESSTPPYLQWRESLRTLLEDSDGVQLFRGYLENEKCVEYLDFWLACEGLKRTNDAKKSANLIRIIHRKYIRGHSTTQAVGDKTRKFVEENVESAVNNANVHVFDDAQTQMEEFMNANMYPNFLQSDLYLNYIQTQDVKGCDSSDSGSCCGVMLATVDENEVLASVGAKGSSSELHRRMMMMPSLSGHARLSGKKKLAGWKRGEPYVGSNPSGQIEKCSYALYAPYVTVSVQDSELQSLSSDAHTDDAMSLTDNSSVDGYSINSKKHLRQARRNASQNREMDPYIRKFPSIRSKAPSTLAPEEFAAILTQKLEDVIRKQENASENEKNMAIRLVELENSSVDLTISEPSKPSHSFPFSTFLKLSHTEDTENQSILDAHVNRIWNDSVHHSPIAPWSPRAHSPDRQRMSVGYHSQSQSRNASSSHHHRQKCRDHVSSNLSTDSGTVRDYPPNGSSDMGHPRAHHRMDSCKEQMNRRSSGRSSCENAILAGSGFSVSINPNEKVQSWMNHHTEDSRHRKSSTSSVPYSQGKTKKPIAYNASRLGWLEHGGSGMASRPPFVQPLEDTKMPMLPPPNTMTQLEEARRRLEDDSQAARLSRSKSGYPLKEKMSLEKVHLEVQKARTLPTRPSVMCDLSAGGDVGFNKKTSRKTGPTSTSNLPNETNDVTSIVYCLQGESVPYLTKIAGKNVTLGQFKSLLSKKGKYRYFFKTANNEFGTGVVNEEVTDDDEILPLWEGKVCAQVHVIE